jgi:hypothetical protein
MAIKPEDQFTREEEFCNVTTSYAMAKQIMLHKKFEAFFTVKLQGDTEKAVERDTAVWQAEKYRKQNAAIRETIVGKLMEETFDDIPFLKTIKGPFYQLTSEQGPLDDDFSNIGT